MRRPTFCQNSVGAIETPVSTRQDKEETRLARMKRLITGSMWMGRRPANLKSFGVCLENLPQTNEGVPVVVVRMVTFIEIYGLQIEGLFRLSGGNPKIVESLKISFDRTGDADLEGCGDVTSVASLLKVWLKDLPEPVVSEPVTLELVTLLHKYKGDIEWCTEARNILKSLNERNASLLQYLLRLLYIYQSRQKDNYCILQNLASVFSPLLLCADSTMPGISNPDTNDATAALISHYTSIYKEKIGDLKVSGANSPEIHLYPTNSMPITIISEPSKKQRKRKDRQSDLIDERKFVRSNSEERPCKTGSFEPEIIIEPKDSIRRVSSHEDFSRSRTVSKTSAHLMELISETANNVETSTAVTQPLQELNNTVPVRSSASNKNRSCNGSNNTNNNSSNANNNNNERVCNPLKLDLDNTNCSDNLNSPTVICSTVGYASELFDENEHERRRNTERFAPQMPRVTNRRRKKPSKSKSNKKCHKRIDDHEEGSSSKENEDKEESNRVPRLQASFSGDESVGCPDPPGNHSRSPSGSSSSSSPSFLHLYCDYDQFQEDKMPREGSPHSEKSLENLDRVMTSSPLDFDPDAPITCGEVDWSFAHHQPQNLDLSPRNDAMFPARRVFQVSPDDDDNAPPARVARFSTNEDRITGLAKQINSIKKKLRRYDEGFKKEFGYRPSRADKMANPDIKRMIAQLEKLNKEKQALSDGPPLNTPLLELPSSENKKPDKITEEVVHNIEKRLHDRRVSAGRPNDLESMSRKQIADEKVSMQKVLLQLESVYGRPTCKDEKDLVRPFYDQYRLLKRIVVRLSTQSKLKDGVTELGTILEHEQMDFTTGSPPPQTSNPDRILSDIIYSTVESLSPPNTSAYMADENMTAKNDDQAIIPDTFENLHALSSSELVEKQRVTVEEKKNLKRQLKEFEDEFQTTTGRKIQKEDRMPMMSVYAQYKHIKAKLRLLEALLSKKTK